MTRKNQSFYVDQETIEIMDFLTANHFNLSAIVRDALKSKAKTLGFISKTKPEGDEG